MLQKWENSLSDVNLVECPRAPCGWKSAQNLEFDPWLHPQWTPWFSPSFPGKGCTIGYTTRMCDWRGWGGGHITRIVEFYGVFKYCIMEKFQAYIDINSIMNLCVSIYYPLLTIINILPILFHLYSYYFFRLEYFKANPKHHDMSSIISSECVSNSWLLFE